MAQCCPDPHEAGDGPGLRLLPLGRQGLTCRYRCGDACSRPEPNTSSNGYFGDVLRTVLDRRGVLRAGAVLGDRKSVV